MDEFVTWMWAAAAARVGGPMAFRLVMQPLVAVTLAVRAGVADARAGRPAYGWAMATDRTHRAQLLRDGWKDTGRVFVLAVIMDAAFQIVAIGWAYPAENLLVAALLALVPYLLARGPVNRVARLLLQQEPRPEGIS